MSTNAERDAVWRLITRLPANQRIAVVLRYYEDLDDAAIAEILGCSPVTVRTHVMRALNALREHVDISEGADDERHDRRGAAGPRRRRRAHRASARRRTRGGANGLTAQRGDTRRLSVRGQPAEASESSGWYTVRWQPCPGSGCR